ncbi:hypothetical protein ACLKA6_010623 [Drosophila palustris]
MVAKSAAVIRDALTDTGATLTADGSMRRGSGAGGAVVLWTVRGNSIGFSLCIGFNYNYNFIVGGRLRAVVFGRGIC